MNQSYTCQVKENGMLMGEISWNNSTHVLTVFGTIYIDGDMRFDDNGQIVHYQGRGIIYASDDIEFDERVFAGGSGMTNCAADRRNDVGLEPIAEPPDDPRPATCRLLLRQRLARLGGCEQAYAGPRAGPRDRQAGRSAWAGRPRADHEAAAQCRGHVVGVALQLGRVRQQVDVELEEVVGGHQPGHVRGRARPRARR